MFVFQGEKKSLDGSTRNAVKHSPVDMVFISSHYSTNGFHLHPNGGWPWDVKARELANAKANLSSTKVGGMHQGMGRLKSMPNHW